MTKNKLNLIQNIYDHFYIFFFAKTAGFFLLILVIMFSFMYFLDTFSFFTAYCMDLPEQAVDGIIYVKVLPKNPQHDGMPLLRFLLKIIIKGIGPCDTMSSYILAKVETDPFIALAKKQVTMMSIADSNRTEQCRLLLESYKIAILSGKTTTTFPVC